MKKWSEGLESSRQQGKENTVKELCRRLEKIGYRVRRERLKQGPGWKAVSGKCRLGEERMIFVDRKSPLDDQLLFLQGLVDSLGAA